MILAPLEFCPECIYVYIPRYEFNLQNSLYVELLIKSNNYNTKHNV